MGLTRETFFTRDAVIEMEKEYLDKLCMYVM